MVRAAQRFVRIQERGQVTLPAEVRRRQGLKKGDRVAVIETPAGILLSPQPVHTASALDRAGETIEQQGVSVAELLAASAEDHTAAGYPLHRYTEEELAEFQADDVLQDEDLAIVRRFGWPAGGP